MNTGEIYDLEIATKHNEKNFAFNISLKPVLYQFEPTCSGKSGGVRSSLWQNHQRNPDRRTETHERIYCYSRIDLQNRRTSAQRKHRTWICAVNSHSPSGTGAPWQLFEIGGTNTVRGWEYAAQRGKSQFISTLEYRITVLEPRLINLPFNLRYRGGMHICFFGDLGIALHLGAYEIMKTKYTVAQIEKAVAEEILKIPGFVAAVTRTDLINGTLAPTPLNKMIQNNFHPKRSGHVHVVADQFWYFAYEMDDVTKLAAIHGSPWSYDTYVPLFFAGHRIPEQKIGRLVTPYDIAATIAA